MTEMQKRAKLSEEEAERGDTQSRRGWKRAMLS